MNIKIIMIAVAMILTALVLPADGAIWWGLSEGPTVADALVMTEEAQRGFLYFDADTGTQSLIVEVRTQEFQGSFVWLIPLPYVPADVSENADVEEHTIGAGEDRFFELLREVTRPTVYVETHQYFYDSYEGYPDYPDYGFGCGCRMLLYGALDGVNELAENSSDETEEPIIFWETGLTENFAYRQLIVTDQQGDGVDGALELESWLYEHGYGRIAGATRGMLAQYVSRGFSFLLITGNKANLSPVHSRVRITYTCDVTAYFPLYISSVGLAGSMNVELYVCGSDYLEPISEEASDLLLAYHYNSETFAELGRTTAEAESESFYQTIEPFDYEFVYSTDRDAADFTDLLLEKIDDLRADTLWQEAALEVNVGSSLWDTITSALPELTTADAPAKMTVFRRRIETSQLMEDLYFVPAQGSRSAFSPAVYVHVDTVDYGFAVIGVAAGGVAPRGARPSQHARADLGIFFPFGFLLWLKTRIWIPRARNSRRERSSSTARR